MLDHCYPGVNVLIFAYENCCVVVRVDVACYRHWLYTDLSFWLTFLHFIRVIVNCVTALLTIGKLYSAIGGCLLFHAQPPISEHDNLLSFLLVLMFYSVCLLVVAYVVFQNAEIYG